MNDKQVYGFALGKTVRLGGGLLLENSPTLVAYTGDNSPPTIIIKQRKSDEEKSNRL